VRAVTAGPDAYEVVLREDPEGWSVLITDHDGATLSERAWRDAAEAMTYASTVRQHLYWLSPKKFREYYRITEPA